MDNTEENAIELHGDEEIIEVIDLNDTEPGPGTEGVPAYLSVVVLSPNFCVFGEWNRATEVI